MNWLSKFLWMRRRYGSVKLACLLFLMALYFVVQSIRSVVDYAGFSGGSVEYILAAGSPEGVQNSDLVKLKKLEAVIAVSPQKVSHLTYERESEAKTLAITEVYAEYLQRAYEIKLAEAGTFFYLNEMAWEEIAEEAVWDGIAGSGNGSDRTEKRISMSYCTEEGENKTAWFVLENDLDNSFPMAYTAGNSVSLAGSASIRVMTGKADITGKTLEKIGALGYSAENEQEIREGRRELEVVMLKLKYSIMIAGLAAALGYVLVKRQTLE